MAHLRTITVLDFRVAKYKVVGVHVWRFEGVWLIGSIAPLILNLNNYWRRLCALRPGRVTWWERHVTRRFGFQTLGLREK